MNQSSNEASLPPALFASTPPAPAVSIVSKSTTQRMTSPPAQFRTTPELHPTVPQQQRKAGQLHIATTLVQTSSSPFLYYIVDIIIIVAVLLGLFKHKEDCVLTTHRMTSITGTMIISSPLPWEEEAEHRIEMGQGSIQQQHSQQPDYLLRIGTRMIRSLVVVNENEDGSTNNNDNGLTPPFRTWELDSNDSRYDHLLAAPSDSTLKIMWSAWAGIALIVGVLSLIVFLGILSNRKARNNSFNMYVLLLAFPDYFFALACGTTCLLNALKGSYWSQPMCNFQQFYITFGIAANTWLNAVLTWQLHKMLRYSHQRRRYRPPTRRDVSKQAICVYIYSTFLGSWGFINNSPESPTWFPYHTGVSSGLACMTIETSKASTIFYYVCFIPMFIGIPIVYIIGACIDIYRRKLLPPTNKRHMFIYYGRIILVFFLMWFPTLILAFIASSWIPTWGFWAGGTFSHLQGATSAAVSMMKPDINRAVKEFISCKHLNACCQIIEKDNNATVPDDVEHCVTGSNHHPHDQNERGRFAQSLSFSWRSQSCWTPWLSLQQYSSRRLSYQAESSHEIANVAVATTAAVAATDDVDNSNGCTAAITTHSPSDGRETIEEVEDQIVEDGETLATITTTSASCPLSNSARYSSHNHSRHFEDIQEGVEEEESASNHDHATTTPPVAVAPMP